MHNGNINCVEQNRRFQFALTLTFGTHSEAPAEQFDE